jgi:hypothetical protein
MDEEVKNMGCGCSYGETKFSTQKARSFLTKEEKVELLKEYKNELEREAQGVSERIKEIEIKN